MAGTDPYHRYFRIAGITVCITSDLDFSAVKFRVALLRFAVDGPGEDNVTLHHHFGLPALKKLDLGKTFYRKVPWAISHRDDRWHYLGISNEYNYENLQWVGIFNNDHTEAVIYSKKRFEGIVRHGERDWPSLSLLPTDQVWLAPLLADRNAVLLHSAGVILNGQGLLFVGHSEAGKTTTVDMLKGKAEILCDDRNIARLWNGGWRVHGTWSHGDVTDVSAASAPLRAILFLKQDKRNELVPLSNRKRIWKELLATLVKSFATGAWWRKEMDVLEHLIGNVPCYVMHFDKSGGIVPELEKLARTDPNQVRTDDKRGVIRE